MENERKLPYSFCEASIKLHKDITKLHKDITLKTTQRYYIKNYITHEHT